MKQFSRPGPEDRAGKRTRCYVVASQPQKNYIYRNLYITVAFSQRAVKQVTEASSSKRQGAVGILGPVDRYNRVDL
jgi:hypothetical protein